MSLAPETRSNKPARSREDVSSVTEEAQVLGSQVPRTHVRVVLPAFNEAESLHGLIPRVAQTFLDSGCSCDLIVVDDGSTDGTCESANELAIDFPFVNLVKHSENRGLGAAITTCLREGIVGLKDDDIVIAMDADNTHPPQLMTRMIPMIREGHDIVIASRYQRGARAVGLARHRELLSIGARLAMQLLFPIRGVRDYTCGYRAYRVGVLRKALEQQHGVLVHEQGFACMAELLILLSRQDIVIGEVPLLLRYDYKRGASKMRVLETIGRTFRMAFRHRFQRSS